MRALYVALRIRARAPCLMRAFSLSLSLSVSLSSRGRAYLLVEIEDPRELKGSMGYEGREGHTSTLKYSVWRVMVRDIDSWEWRSFGCFAHHTPRTTGTIKLSPQRMANSHIAHSGRWTAFRPSSHVPSPCGRIASHTHGRREEAAVCPRKPGSCCCCCCWRLHPEQGMHSSKRGPRARLLLTTRLFGLTP